MNLNLSYNWIKEYLKADKPIEEFVREFSLRSQTIDRANKVEPKFIGITTAKILKIEKHPNADRLKLATVDSGKGEQTVVCGANNIEEGQIVPLASIGSEVIDFEAGKNFTIKKAKIRDVESNGMLCSQRELGLGDDHTGIMILPEDTPIGKPLEKVLDLNDYLLEIEVTSNRPDAMSVVGLAREAAAALNIKDNIKVPEVKLEKTEEIPLSVEIKESKLCPRYNAVVMTGVKVGPSPLWMQLRLMQSGMRPINNLVDITNYILLEYGRPMHVFDYEKLNDQKIIVRKAKVGEKILALDGNNYDLKPEHLVIADGKNPVAIGGVMGGELSAATQETKTIVFEAAAFDPVLIRKTARDLNLHSDSSDLFEKNLHPESTFIGILRAIELTQEIAGGTVASPIIDVYAKKYKPNKIKFDPACIKRYLGVEIEIKEIKRILESLGFEVSGSNILNVITPWWRAYDVEFEHDLVEEVARIYGYHNLPTELPVGQIPIDPKNQKFFWEGKTKDLLAGIGFSEVYNYSMVSKEMLNKVGFSEKQALQISNELNEEMEYMRTTLLPQVLQNVSDNLNNFTNQKIFELSNIYIPAKPKNLPDELPRLVGAVVGDDSFLISKGVVEFLLEKMGIKNYELKLTDCDCPIWEKDLALDVILENKFLGQFGIINQKILNKFDIKKPVAVFDFDFTALVEVATTVKTFVDLPEFPNSTRDLSLLIDKKISWQEIKETVSKANKLITEVKYLSTFVDKSLGENKKSLALRIIFSSPERTLKSEEVDQIINKLVKELENKFQAKLR